jgi:peptide/nickel transport system substrate-binding protein
MSRDRARDSEEGLKKFEEFLRDWSRRDFVKRMGTAAAYSVFLSGGAAALEACANAGTSGTTTNTNVKKGGHVVEANISDIKTLNPVLISDTASSQVSGMLYDSLYTSKANGDLVPQIAKDQPKVSSDGLTYTVSLRTNVKFTDGSTVTADDVKFTYDLMFDPAYKDVNSPRRGDLETYVQSITVKDPQTIVFTLKKVYAPFQAAQMQYGILPKKTWGNLKPTEVNTTDMNTNPTVTNGAWKFVKWDKGQQVTLNKNPDYWNGAPNLDTYVYKVVADSVAQANQLKTGEVDYASLDPSQLSNVQANPDITIVTFPVAIFTFYAYNQNSGVKVAKIFQDKAVRQALLYAVDRQGMVDALYFKQAVVANSSEPPVGWAYNANTSPKYGLDPAKAESMLDAAGYKKGADGIRANAAGDRLSFTMITNAGNKVRENSLVAMQDAWKKIGVDATPKLITFPQLVSQITNDRNYDVFLVGFSWTQDPDQSALWASRNTAPGGFNGFGYKSTAVDKILDDAVATLDQNKRKQLYFQLQNALADDVPAPILVFNKGIWGFSKRMQGYQNKDTTIGTYTQFGARPWMNSAWVQDGK